MYEEPKYILKITLLGEKNVGKTSLVYRYIENKFRESYKATLGVNLLKKDMEVDGNSVSAQIWDLGGQDSFKSLRKLYLEGANGALVMFDLTERKTFEKLNEWVESFKEARGEQPIVLIGNKSDLENQRKITDMEASNYAKENNMELMLTSAKTGQNVEEAFIKLTKRILDNISNQ
ncbi:MAG: GTP-binding protein [Candidatus Lokiarchaeota archaeon]|nr:GTP-binding protein [Candidatus Lokiarchaeota archaeon]MCK4382109.1 GTP-binding protein [Candidatus Lokiarchaeota archaeon]